MHIDYVRTYVHGIGNRNDSAHVTIKNHPCPHCPVAKERERSLLRSLYSSGDPDDRLNLEKSCVPTTGKHNSY